MTTAPPVEWGEFLPYFRAAWRQGEHVTYVGPTGSGKTTLALEVLPIRRYVLALATKPKDDTMTRLSHRTSPTPGRDGRGSGWPIIREWPPPRRNRNTDRMIVWPAWTVESQRHQQDVLYRAIVGAFEQGGWTIFADELFYLCRYLGLTRVLEMIWTQGRSVGITLVGGTQRPAHVPLLAYDQATHLFFWRDNDETNLRRIGGLGGLNSADIRRTVSTLPKHHALYLNTRTGEQAITLAPKPKG